jgi:hypothetical protein
VRQIRSPFRGRGCFEDRSALGTKAPKSQTSVNAEILTSRRRCRTRVRGTWRGCGGGFAEQVTGNVEKGEAPAPLRERLEIRLNIDLVASSVLSSKDGVRHWGLVLKGSAATLCRLRLLPTLTGHSGRTRHLQRADFPECPIDSSSPPALRPRRWRSLWRRQPLDRLPARPSFCPCACSLVSSAGCSWPLWRRPSTPTS